MAELETAVQHRRGPRLPGWNVAVAMKVASCPRKASNMAPNRPLVGV